MVSNPKKGETWIDYLEALFLILRVGVLVTKNIMKGEHVALKSVPKLTIEKISFMLGATLVGFALFIWPYHGLWAAIIFLLTGSSILLISAKEHINNNKATVITSTVTALVGIGANLYVSHYSTQKISEALHPNNFMVKVLDDDKWYEPTQTAVNQSDNTRRKFSLAIPIGRQTALRLSFMNKAKFPANDVFVILHFRNDEIDITVGTIGHHFTDEHTGFALAFMGCWFMGGDPTIATTIFIFGWSPLIIVTEG